MLGCPVVVVSKQLGHSGTAMTEKHYAHLSQNYVAQSIKQFGPTYTKPQE
jgi:integrase